MNGRFHKHMIATLLFIYYQRNERMNSSLTLDDFYRYDDYSDRMEDLCGGNINMAKDSVYTAVIKFHGAAKTQNCVLSVSPGSQWNKLSFQITKHSNEGDSCLKFSHKVEGSKGKQVIPGLYGKYCGSAQPPTKRQFTVDKLYISFTPHSIQFYFYLTFEIVITVFKEDGDCDDFQCNNKRCIPNDLQCSAHNPCGDSSDCPDEADDNSTTLAQVIGLVVGGAVGAVVIMCAFKRCSSASNEESVDMDLDAGDNPMDFEIQPLYNTENGIGATFSDPGDQADRHIDISQENIDLSIYPTVSSGTNVTPSVPVLNITTDRVSRPERIHTRTDEVELHIANDSNENSDVLANIADSREASELPPPPTYESVMANADIYNVTQ